jgi:hypothetical protein
VSTFIAIPVPGFEDFFLCGQSSGDLGEIVNGQGKLSDAYVEINRVVGPLTKSPSEQETAPCDLSLAHPIRVPAGLVETNRKLRNTAQLQTALNAAGTDLRPRVLTMIEEAQRRLNSVEVNFQTAKARFLGIDTPFGGAKAFAGAQLQLRLWTRVEVAGVTSFSVQTDLALAAFAKVMAGNVERAFSLVVVLKADSGVALRIDSDEFGLRFPTFKLPSFDLGTDKTMLLLLQNELEGAESTLKQLGLDAEVTVRHSNPSPTGTKPKLALKLRDDLSGFDWGIVTDDFKHADDMIGSKLAQFEIEKKGMAGKIEIAIENLTLGQLQSGSLLAGTVKARMDPISLGESAPRRFGPFEISWKEMVITPSHQGNTFGTAAADPYKGASLRAVIAFDRLTIRVHDDHDAFLTFNGKIEVDPSGTRLLELALVAPFPLELLGQAAGAMLRGAAAVIHVLADFGELTAERAAKLLDILGRMALAAGRAAIFVAEKVGAELNALGDMIASGLAAMAEMLGELFKRLGEMFASPGADLTAFTLELRVATNPFELRQVLISSRNPDTAVKPRTHKLLGITLDMPGEWRPGLLIDFVTQPGAYFVLSREKDDTPNNMRAVTLSTDLWLDVTPKDKPTTSRPLRDADGNADDKKPGPSVRDKELKPLLGLGLNFKDDTENASDIVVVLAGLSRGQPVFFQRLVGKADLVYVPGKPTVQVRTSSGPFRLQPLADEFELDVEFEPKRILPLLGMGETGNEAAPSDGPNFLEKLQGSLSNVVWVKESKTRASLKSRTAGVDLNLGLKAAGLETSLTVNADISLDNLAMTFKAGDTFPLVSQRIEETALGLVWVIEQADENERKANAKIDMFKLGFSGGQSGFELNSAKPNASDLKGTARMQLRFNGLSSDGQGIVFEVEVFKIGPGGLDLKAKVTKNPVRLNGIDVPFHFSDGAIEIRGGRLVTRDGLRPRRVAAGPNRRGRLHDRTHLRRKSPEGIVLQSGKVELDKKERADRLPLPRASP